MKSYKKSVHSMANNFTAQSLYWDFNTKDRMILKETNL